MVDGFYDWSRNLFNEIVAEGDLYALNEMDQILV
jgi:hypothetical protein